MITITIIKRSEGNCNLVYISQEGTVLQLLNCNLVYISQERTVLQLFNCNLGHISRAEKGLQLFNSTSFAELRCHQPQ